MKRVRIFSEDKIADQIETASRKRENDSKHSNINL